MRIETVRIHALRMPLTAPFTTSFGTQVDRDVLIIELVAHIDGARVTGWGECVAMRDPLYSSEYVAAARDVLQRYLIAALVNAGDITAETVQTVLAPYVGHRMAKAALEMAVLDAQLRAADVSFGRYLGATVDRVPSGVSVGIQDSIDLLLRTVDGYLAQGYQRIKLKIKPGRDIEPVRQVRAAYPDAHLQVDANAAYTLADTRQLKRLDDFDLLLIEQPLGEEDLRQHALLAQRLATPICLDESVVSAQSSADAIALGAAAVINIKPGRVGGYLEAARIHDVCRANGIAVWCGGMLETGLGRAANAALAALPGFVLPGDISASGRFYAQDITAPFELEDGYIRVPTGPGLGVEPDRSVIESFTIDVQET